MKKATGKPKGKTSRPAKKRTSRKSKKPVDLVEVRKDITNIVGTEATELTRAVVEEGRKGQLAPVKYLFEVAGLYPAAEGDIAKPEGESLAKTLLHRLGLPEETVVRQEEEPPLKLNLPAAKSADEDEEAKNSGSQPETANSQSAHKDADDGDDIPVSAESIS